MSRDPHWADFRLDSTAEERRSYLEAYAARRRPYIEQVWRENPVPGAGSNLGERFRAHFESLGTFGSSSLPAVPRVFRAV